MQTGVQMKKIILFPNICPFTQNSEKYWKLRPRQSFPGESSPSTHVYCLTLISYVQMVTLLVHYSLLIQELLLAEKGGFNSEKYQYLNTNCGSGTRCKMYLTINCSQQMTSTALLQHRIYKQNKARGEGTERCVLWPNDKKGFLEKTHWFILPNTIGTGGTHEFPYVSFLLITIKIQRNRFIIEEKKTLNFQKPAYLQSFH